MCCKQDDADAVDNDTMKQRNDEEEGEEGRKDGEEVSHQQGEGSCGSSGVIEVDAFSSTRVNSIFQKWPPT